MKARQEFETDSQYKEYLRFYYSGLALQSIGGVEAENNQRSQQNSARKAAEFCIKFSEELIKLLMPEKR